MFYIYKMIHLPSGRIYIGQRKVPKGKTFESDSYCGSGIVWRAIYKKHKEECVKVIIDTASSKEEIDKLEKRYIAHYKNVYGEFCVNIAEGGIGGGCMSGRKHTDETRKKMSESAHGRKMPEEIRNKISESVKKAWNTRRKENA